MCGIAGVTFRDPMRRPEHSVLKSMGDAIAHRGPDAEGFFADAGVGLVHRRLSIIDLAGGDQPLGNEDGSIQIVFNGEIYNFQELREELIAKGHRFRTRSDTEVLVHLYEEYGEELVHRLRGMFAFAIWDRNERTLFLARDRLGIKPLYYYHDDEKLLFGSELKAILAFGDIPRALSLEALEDYFTYGMVPGERCIFKNIGKLAPGHSLKLAQSSWHAVPRRYWQLRMVPQPDRSETEWQEVIRAKIDESVRLHLIADVPVGAFLSGGMDSSIMVASASERSPKPLQTFSMGFEEDSFSELPFARQVARQFGTTHREEIVKADVGELLDQLVFHYDEPFADSSAIPSLLVARLASRSVKVVLSGDGGDEAFGGYRRYAHDLREAAVRRWLPRWLRRGVLGPLGRAWPKADWLPRPLRAKTLFTNLAKDAGEAYANTLAICREPLRRRLFSRSLGASLNGYQPEHSICNAYAGAPSNDPLAGMLTADTSVILPDDFLVKVDRASMAHGLEVRPPLLDHELLELAAQIPSSLKVRKSETKWILKRAYDRKLPAEVVWRKKHGFEIPIDNWLRGPLREMFHEVVLAPRSHAAALIDQPTVAGLLRSHQSGWGTHGAMLWSVLVLARWAERWKVTVG